MRKCEFVTGERCGDGRVWVQCSRCRLRFCAREDHVAGLDADCEPKPVGLGDMVAAGLEAIGITKARVSAALGVKDCGCGKRQEALNALGRTLGIGIPPAAADGEAGRTASAPYP